MPVMKFTDEDIKAGFLVQNPGRYNYEIVDIKEKPAKSDGSPNYTFVCVGLSGEMKGVRVFVMASSKAGWLITPIFKAANNGVPLEAGRDYNTDDLKGVKVSAMTVRGQRDDGSYFNSLVDWKPFDGNLI